MSVADPFYILYIILIKNNKKIQIFKTRRLFTASFIFDKIIKKTKNFFLQKYD